MHGKSFLKLFVHYFFNILYNTGSHFFLSNLQYFVINCSL